MEITGIDHIELYVGDAYQSAFYFGTAFGFRLCGQGGPETGLAQQRSLLLKTGNIRYLLTTGLADDHPAARYAQRHGDGIAVIALAVDDAAAVYQQLIKRGASAVSAPRTHRSGDAVVVTAEVGGFGDVVHRLVERRGQGGEFLPGVVEVPKPRQDVGDLLLREIDHIAVCLPNGELDPWWPTTRRSSDSRRSSRSTSTSPARA